VIVLSQKVVTSLFADPNSAVGQQVSYNGLAFTVIGVYEHRWRSTAFIPISTADMLQGKTGEVSEINATLTDVNSTDKALKVESDIRHAMAQSHEFDPDDQGAVSAWNRCENFLRMQLGGSILNIAAWVIGLFTLLSGVIGVSNIMFVSVHERTHEIGIRRAIGAKPRNILTQILLESVAITTLFGYVGIVMGTVVMEIVARLTEGSEAFSNPRVDLSITIYVTITLIICGAAAGLFPALKALKVKPVEALRDE
jgi:putative ABC transport system permease protein